MKLDHDLYGEGHLKLESRQEVVLALIAIEERLNASRFNPELKADLEVCGSRLGGVLGFIMQHPEIAADSQSFVMEPEASIIALESMRWLVASKKHRKKMSMDEHEVALATLDQ